MEQTRQIKQFQFYDFYAEILNGLNDESAGRIARLMCEYMFTDNAVAEIKDDKERFYWGNIVDVLQESKENEIKGKQSTGLNRKMKHFTFQDNFYDAIIILCDTAGMDRKTWLACRMHGPKGDIPYTVGGSDVAAIFGVSPWTTPLELWRIKKGLMDPPVKANDKQLMMGHLLEPIAAQLYAEKTGDTVYEDTNLYQHADHPYALANFDRRLIRKSNGEQGILECKSTSYHKADAWALGAYPLYYEFQLRFYLAVSDLNFGAFSAVWGNNPETDLATPSLVRDKAKEDIIFEKLDEFIWSLENDKPPTMQDVAPKLALESLARIYGNSIPGLPTIEFPKEYEADLRRIAQLQGEISEHNSLARKLEKEVEAHSVRIAELMKEHEYGVLETTSDKLLIDFVTKSKTTTDKDKLKEIYPTVFDDVQKTTHSRKLKVSVAAI